jgi:hypothetical protein
MIAQMPQEQPKLSSEERNESWRQYINTSIPPWWANIDKAPCDCGEHIQTHREEKPHFTFSIFCCPHKAWGVSHECKNVMEG